MRLENQGWKRSNENVFGIDYKGRVLWQIAERAHAFTESHYVNIYRRNELVEAYNWDGTILCLDPKTGEVLSESLDLFPVQASNPASASLFRSKMRTCKPPYFMTLDLLRSI